MAGERTSTSSRSREDRFGICRLKRPSAASTQLQQPAPKRLRSDPIPDYRRMLGLSPAVSRMNIFLKFLERFEPSKRFSHPRTNGVVPFDMDFTVENEERHVIEVAKLHVKDRLFVPSRISVDELAFDISLDLNGITSKLGERDWKLKDYMDPYRCGAFSRSEGTCRVVISYKE